MAFFFHRFDHLGGNAHHRIAGKADHHGFPGLVGLKTGQSQRRFDDRRKILVRDVPDPGPSHQSGGENVILVGFFRFLDAVGGHENGAGKRIEFAFLVLPGRAVMTVKMRIFFQFRIPVARQHFPVGIDIDALARGLPEQCIQILQIVAGHQDRFSPFGAQRYRSGHRMAVGAGVGRIEQFHGAQVHLTALEGESHQFIHAQAAVQGGGHGLVDKGENGLVRLAEDRCVVRIGGQSLETVDEQLPQGTDVFVFVRIGFDAGRFPLGHHGVDGG